ncbi:MAG: hypothetical protein AAF066_19815 [Pseudomonadota bacterium]
MSNAALPTNASNAHKADFRIGHGGSLTLPPRTRYLHLMVLNDY